MRFSHSSILALVNCRTVYSSCSASAICCASPLPVRSNSEICSLNCSIRSRSASLDLMLSRSLKRAFFFSCNSLVSTFSVSASRLASSSAICFVRSVYSLILSGLTSSCLTSESVASCSSNV